MKNLSEESKLSKLLSKLQNEQKGLLRDIEKEEEFLDKAFLYDQLYDVEKEIDEVQGKLNVIGNVE